MPPHCRIEMFGGFRVLQGERVIDRFATQKAAGLLAYLAYHLPQRHPREVLIEVFWPGGLPSAGRDSLSTALSSLRRQLEPPGTVRGAVILADRQTVGLNAAAIETDVGEFERALAGARDAPASADRLRCLVEALDVYRGELLPGFYEEWVLGEQRRLAEEHSAASRRVVGHLQQAGDLDRAVERARRTVSIDPLREEAHLQLVQLYVATGQADLARAQYRDMERLLREQLGAEPSVAAQRLGRQLEREEAPSPPPNPFGGGDPSAIEEELEIIACDDRKVFYIW